MKEGVYQKLLTVQSLLKAPKGKYNSFGKYHYRSAEDILESVKPLLAKEGLCMAITDDVVAFGDRLFLKATVHLTDGSDSVSTIAFAEIAPEKKGMDVSQITGTASSYARKYALNGLFLIDDTKDADTDEYQEQTQNGELIATVGSRKISKTKAAALETELVNANVNIERLLQKLCLSKLTDMTEEQHLDIINKLNKANEHKG